jgi:hypothetical protein
VQPSGADGGPVKTV